MNTKLARDMGLEFPIFAFTHCRDVAAAVSKAGGIGVFGVAAHTASGLRAELEWIEKEIGDKPYGVDLLLPTTFVGSDKAGGFSEDELDAKIPDEHRRFVDDLLEQHSVPALPADVELGRELAIGYERQKEIIEIVFEHNISLIASALGPPPQWLIDMAILARSRPWCSSPKSSMPWAIFPFLPPAGSEADDRSLPRSHWVRRESGWDHSGSPPKKRRPIRSSRRNS